MAIRRAAPDRHQSGRSQLAQVVRDEILRPAQQVCQLPDVAVTASQFPEQLPPHRIARQARKSSEAPAGPAFRRDTRQRTSICIDAVGGPG
jgi:hypothetical protein